MSESHQTYLSVTRLRVRRSRPDVLIGFLGLSQRNMVAAQTTPGFIDGAVWIDRHLSFWTITLWQDAASMKAFARGPVHIAAMKHLQGRGQGYSEAAFASGVSPTAQLPTQAEVATFLESQPIFAALPRPSSDHRARRFPSPKPHFVQRLEPSRSAL